MADASKEHDRDERGRFKPGNAGGPGGARRRALAFRQAADQAITTEHVEAIIRKATRMALEGNLSAMRFVLERVSGRAAEAPVDNEPIEITIPRLRTINDCNRATESLIDGLCKGNVAHDAAKLLIDAIQTRLKGIEASQLEECLAQLESAAAATQHGGSHRAPDPRFE